VDNGPNTAPLLPSSSFPLSSALFFSPSDPFLFFQGQSDSLFCIPLPFLRSLPGSSLVAIHDDCFYCSVGDRRQTFLPPLGRLCFRERHGYERPSSSEERIRLFPPLVSMSRLPCRESHQSRALQDFPSLIYLLCLPECSRSATTLAQCRGMRFIASLLQGNALRGKHNSKSAPITPSFSPFTRTSTF